MNTNKKVTGKTGTKKTSPTVLPVSIKPVPPKNDPANIGRRRFAKPTSDTPCQRVVVKFPVRGTGLVRVPATGGTGKVLQLKEWLAWDDASDTSNDASVQPALNAANEPSITGGSLSAGVLMPPIALPEVLSGYRPNDAGVLAHAVIAVLAPDFHLLSEFELPERIWDVAGSFVNGDNVNRRRTLVATAAGYVATYFRRFALRYPWELLGAEFDTTNGRCDLAWSHVDDRVLFDEVKTMNRPQAALNPAWVKQAARYAIGGRNRYTDNFVGTRLIPLGSLHLATLVGPDGGLSQLPAGLGVDSDGGDWA